MNHNLLSVLGATVVTASASAGISPTFGTLGGDANPVQFQTGSGISNSDFWYTTQSFNGHTLVIGANVGMYYSGANPVSHLEGNQWVAQAGFNQSTSGSATAPRWAFRWSVTIDGALPTAADGLSLGMRITSPNGNWGIIYPGFMSLPGGSTGDTYAQNAWVMNYSFLQANSAQLGAPAGLWSGLAFDATQIGTYKFDIGVFSGASMLQGGVAVYANVVPGPSGLALVGLASVLGRRRRR